MLNSRGRTRPATWERLQVSKWNLGERKHWNWKKIGTRFMLGVLAFYIGYEIYILWTTK